jgi:nucleoside-diphosphate-sugar epimerase
MGREEGVVRPTDLGRVLVTGGGGFLGTALIRLLVDRGLLVRSLARRHYPHLPAHQVEQIQGDIADAGVVARAVDGCQTVFHTAAKAGIWGSDQDYERINVQGTHNVIAACRAHGSRRIIYSSSPSVVFNGLDMEGADESVPYSARFEAAYPRTKARAEQIILGSNSASLATISIRPHLIWGPGDNNLLPRILARARRGQLRRIGRRDPLIDPIYIDNAAEAHLLAADRLEPGAEIAGRSYFVTQGETIPLWDMINHFLKAAGLAPVNRSVARPLALAAAGTLELAYFLSRTSQEPPMTRFLARQLSTTHWFNIAAARRDLEYEPRVSIAEGLRRLESWLKNGQIERLEHGVR